MLHAEPKERIGVARRYYIVLLLTSSAVLAWDLWHLVPDVADLGLSGALRALRTARRVQSGAYRLPGIEVAHAASMATGVLGYGLWLLGRNRLGLAGVLLGFAGTLTSTGRWDVMTFAIWCFLIQLILRPPAGRFSLSIGYVRMFALMGIFFIVHGELLKKVESLERFAQMSAEQRERKTSDPALLGLPSALEDAGSVPMAVWRGTGRTCPHWESGVVSANQSLRKLGRASRVFVIYFAGPLAGLDRASCENRFAARNVIFYWPLKLAYVTGLDGRHRGQTVDAYIDVGIPTNNFTVIYSFVSELGFVLGPGTWLALALVVRAFVRWSLQGTMGLPGVTAASSVALAAVPTPLTNLFFDGTLFTWLAVALGAWAYTRRGTVDHHASSIQPADCSSERAPASSRLPWRTRPRNGVRSKRRHDRVSFPVEK